MDNFVIADLPGVKQIKLNCFFVQKSVRIGGRTKNGFEHYQEVTACIIRHNSKILGTGATLQHPDDEDNEEAAHKSAVKVAAEAASYSIYLEMLNAKEMEVTDPIEIKKAIYRAWRTLMRVRKEESDNVE